MIAINKREDVSVALVVRHSIGEIVGSCQEGDAEPELPLTSNLAFISKADREKITCQATFG